MLSKRKNLARNHITSTKQIYHHRHVITIIAVKMPTAFCLSHRIIRSDTPKEYRKTKKKMLINLNTLFSFIFFYFFIQSQFIFRFTSYSLSLYVYLFNLIRSLPYGYRILLLNINYVHVCYNFFVTVSVTDVWITWF